jgi:hypothetical protein
MLQKQLYQIVMLSNRRAVCKSVRDQSKTGIVTVAYRTDATFR